VGTTNDASDKSIDEVKTAIKTFKRKWVLESEKRKGIRDKG
jgi:hypothetical protein